MTHKSYKGESRKNWGTQDNGLSIPQIQLGAVLRIADSMEKMCTDRDRIERELEVYRQSRRRLRDELDHEKHSNASLRGHLKRIKNERNELATMVKIFRACIETGTFPARGGLCEKKIFELVGENEHS